MRIRLLLLALLSAAVACTPVRRGGGGGGGGDDDDSGDDDDASGDDDDATGDDDDATGDDDDDSTAGDDDDATPGGSEAIADDTWAVDLANGTWVEPAGVGGLFSSFFGDQWLLFSVQDAPTSNFSTGAVHVVTGAGTGTSSSIEQDPCVETTRATAGNDGAWNTGDDDPGLWAQPTLSFGPADGAFGDNGVSLTGVLITASFNGSFSSFSNGTLDAEIDARDLTGLIETEDPEEVCELFEQTAAVTCSSCQSDGQPYCIPVAIVDLTGFPAFSGPLDELTAADVANDPFCE